MRTLTPTQQEVLQLTWTSTRTTGSAPTRSEIARLLGLRSTNAAGAHPQALAQKDVPAVHRSEDAANRQGVDMRKRAAVIDGMGVGVVRGGEAL